MNMKNKKLPFESIAILLQGGGALGSYQGGVYQALCEAGLEPDWVAGISIGAINAAIIAGNAAKDRVGKLREFWEGVTTDKFRYVPGVFKSMLTRSDNELQTLNYESALRAIFMGIPGFFKPRMISPLLAPKDSLAATSFYDTSPLKNTLENLIDFDRINKGNIRFNIGAVNVVSGDFTSFDKKDTLITVDHIMASGALPPGLPPVKIGDEYFWDAGLISNTPLQWLLQDRIDRDTLVFQVDLWSADGEFPQNIAEVFTRQKDIQYSSRTRSNTDRFSEQHKLRHNIARLLEKLPDSIKKLPEAKFLDSHGATNIFNIVHLIYHNKSYEGYSKDCEFSRLSMEAHWLSGYNDTIKTLEHQQVLQRPHNEEGIAIFDFSRAEPITKKPIMKKKAANS